MPGVKPVIDEVKAPVAETAPCVVLASVKVGEPLVFQQTPCWVGLVIPNAVIFPLPVADDSVIVETAPVVTVEVKRVY